MYDIYIYIYIYIYYIFAYYHSSITVSNHWSRFPFININSVLKVVKKHMDPQEKQIISEEQPGFRKNRNTIEHIFNSRLIG